MCNSPFKLPGQYHYDVFQIDMHGARFMCSTSKEDWALEIAETMSRDSFSDVEYRVRTRPTRSHTIFTFKGGSK